MNWSYDFNHFKSGIITFGETKLQHFESLNNRELFLGDTEVEGFTNIRISVSLRITSAYFPQILTTISIRPGKVGMIFSSNLCRQTVNSLVYVKFSRQACLPTLLFGAELFTLTPTLLLRFERCQFWFLENISYVLKFTSGPLLQRFEFN